MRKRLAVLLLLAAPALAAKPRVLVDAPPQVAKIITKLLSKKYTPTLVKSPLADEPTAKQAADATRDLGAIAIVQARRDAKLWTVRVLNGADGTVLASSTFKNAKKLAPPKSFGPTLLSGLKGAASPAAILEPPPAKPEPAATTTPPPAAGTGSTATPPPPPPATKPEPVEPPKKDIFDDSAPAPTVSERPMALRLGLGFTGLNRNFTYRDDLFEALSLYRLPFGPAPVGELELFPGAFFTSGLAAQFGLSGSFNYLVGVSSKAGDVKFPSSSMRLNASAVGRIPLGLLELQVGCGYALQTFAIATTAGGVARPNIPNVSFGGLRPSVGMILHFNKVFQLHLGGAYQVLLSTGELGSSAYFARQTGAGADMWIGVGIRPFTHFEIRARGDYTRYFFSLKPEVGDPYIAGGALDQYLSGTLTANLIF